MTEFVIVAGLLAWAFGFFMFIFVPVVKEYGGRVLNLVGSEYP